MKSRIMIMLAVTALLLAGRGSIPIDRTISGAGIGAAGGVAVIALAGGPVLGAALVGGAAGAAIGAISRAHHFASLSLADLG